MKTLVIYYSFTGNNAALARSVAQKLNAHSIEIKETKKRNGLTIIFDVLLNRVPKVSEPELKIDSYDHLVFVAPVWFGKIATPLRSVFQNIRNKTQSVSLVAFSAGSHGVNQNLEKEMAKRTRKAPKTVINLLVTELLPSNPKPSPKILDEYRLTDDVAQGLSAQIISKLV
jgi:flavodoxin